MGELTVELVADVYPVGDDFLVENLWFAEEGRNYNLIISVADARGVLHIYCNFPNTPDQYLRMLINSPEKKDKIRHKLATAIEEMLENE